MNWYILYTNHSGRQGLWEVLEDLSKERCIYVIGHRYKDATWLPVNKHVGFINEFKHHQDRYESINVLTPDEVEAYLVLEGI